MPEAGVKWDFTTSACSDCAQMALCFGDTPAAPSFTAESLTGLILHRSYNSRGTRRAEHLGVRGKPKFGRHPTQGGVEIQPRGDVKASYLIPTAFETIKGI